MKVVYVVQHVHIIFPQEEEDVKLIGVYSTRKSAEDAVSRLCSQPGFSDFPKIVNFDVDEDQQGFQIEEYQLDLDYWSEGYVTV